MAYFRCGNGNSGGGGGQLTETDLWVNPDPTDYYYGSTAPQLSQKISDFEYIKFYIKPTRTAADSTILSMIIKTDDLAQMTNSGTVVRPCLGAMVNSNSWARYIYWETDRNIYISTCYRLSSSGSTSNIHVIPVKITGLK